MSFYPSSAGTVHIQDPGIVVTVPADALALNGTRSSANTELIT